MAAGDAGPACITEHEKLVARIRGEFLEMPGLRLTPAEAQSLWGLELNQCQRLLDELSGAGFLKRTAGGAYQRLS